MYAYPMDVTVVMEKESITTSSHQTTTQTREEKLKELRKINDDGLITKEIYLERQNEILRNPQSNPTEIPQGVNIVRN